MAGLSEEEKKFWGGLLAKEETQALDFLQKFPDYDGRGIIVGVLDTGVDPGAIGLQTTTTGARKVINIIDCTGSGDVTMYGPVKARDDGCIEGLGGRLLKPNPAWRNPTGEYRVGIKRAFELFPKSLKDRVLEKRKETWEAEHRKVESELLGAVAQASKDSQEEAQASYDQYKNMVKEYEDKGPVYDCLVFHDGDQWVAVIDTSETGDMSNMTPMKEYHVEYEYRRFSDVDALNYGIHIYDNGATLSIVVDAGAHGTHVAGIISAHHPDTPECNGVAPGAQIVSLKIGDSRLGSMETSVGLIRALIQAVKCGCNIINMSYGEAAEWDNDGAFVRLAEEIVYKHNVVFIGSAGNNGPALSTVGAPCGTSSAIISVGAYVTTSLMHAAYSMVNATEPTNFTWSSVGPSIDGSSGVTLMAPGGAITCVPNWTLNKKQLMNGTSMSAPNACGCVTLLLSAIKAQQLFSSNITFRVRAAIENTAQIQPNVDLLGQHHGLIQVTRAYQHLISNKDDTSVDIPLRISVLSARFKRGIYMRHISEVTSISTQKVEITPFFHDGLPAEAKINYEMKLRLQSSNDDVLQYPGHVELLASGRVISVVVNPTKLVPGLHVHYIRGYDIFNEEKGAILEIPVTIIIPEMLTSLTHTLSLRLTDSSRHRHFFLPPLGTTYMSVHVKDTRPYKVESVHNTVDEHSMKMVVFHALQLFLGEPFRDHEKKEYIQLTPGSQNTITFPVSHLMPLEICLAKFWNTLGEANLDITLSCFGVVPSTSSITLNAGDTVCGPLQLRSMLATTNVTPNVKLDKFCSVVYPTGGAKVLPLGERDVLLNGHRIHELTLEYSFYNPEATSIKPQWQGFNDILYETYFYAQFHMLYDSNKQLIASGDAWPSGIQVSKGNYTLRFQLRHTDIALLEQFVSLPVVIEATLKNALKLTHHKTRCNAVSNVNNSTIKMYEGTANVFFLHALPASQLPKYASTGDYLKGTITYNNKNESTNNPVSYPVVQMISVKPADAPAENGAAAEKTPEEHKLKVLQSMVGKDGFVDLYNALTSSSLATPAMVMTKLQHSNKQCSRDAESVQNLLNETYMVESLFDVNSIIVQTSAMSASTTKKEAEKNKSMLAEVYFIRTMAFAQKIFPNVSKYEASLVLDANVDETLKNDFIASYNTLKLWDDVTKEKFYEATLIFHLIQNKKGMALKLVTSAITSANESKKQNAALVKNMLKDALAIVRSLRWSHLEPRLEALNRTIAIDKFNPL